LNREIIMKSKHIFPYSSACLLLTILVAAGTAAAQTPRLQQKAAEAGDTRPGRTLDETTFVEESAGMETAGILLAQPPHTISYQGYLTAISGDPLDGSYEMAFELWNSDVGGVRSWGPEIHAAVDVNNGLFEVALGSILSLHPYIFDEALFLAVWVAGQEVGPRQPLRSVPYAFGMVPGAQIEGDPVADTYAFRIRNSGTDISDRGLYVSGWEYGIYAEEFGSAGDVGIKSPDFVEAKGYRSTDDSYVWVPGTATIPSFNSDCYLYPRGDSSVQVGCSPGGLNQSVLIPITIPGVLLGQDVTIEEVRIYYYLNHTGKRIYRTVLEKFTSTGSADIIIDDLTDRLSTSPTSYSPAIEGNNTLTSSAGALTLTLYFNNDSDTTHYLYVGAVRLRLSHSD
jgi:hypothetical protein